VTNPEGTPKKGHELYFEMDENDQLCAMVDYFLQDDTDATEFHVDLLDPSLALRTDPSSQDLPRTVNEPHLANSIFALADQDPAGTYIAVFRGADAHGADYRDHCEKRMLAVNDRTGFGTLKRAKLHYHPAEDHSAHYDRDEYPLNDRLTMLRSTVKGNAWFSHSPYTQEDPNCWCPPLTPTGEWDPAWGAPSFAWRRIKADVTQRYTNPSQVQYVETVVTYPAWGPTQDFPAGTTRYAVKVSLNGASFDTPRGAKALRMSVRDSAYANPVAQWGTTWLDVPFIMGSYDYEVEKYEGTDCADLLTAAHNKAHPSHPFGYTNAHGLATSSTMTEPGVEGIEGDLVFWDYHTQQSEDPPNGPDGTYDHSMICAGGSAAIWASGGWSSSRGMMRCVIADDWEQWREDKEQAGFQLNHCWRRFR